MSNEDYSDDTLFGAMPTNFEHKGTLDEHYAKLTDAKKAAMKELREIADTVSFFFSHFLIIFTKH